MSTFGASLPEECIVLTSLMNRIFLKQSSCIECSNINSSSSFLWLRKLFAAGLSSSVYIIQLTNSYGVIVYFPSIFKWNRLTNSIFCVGTQLQWIFRSIQRLPPMNEKCGPQKGVFNQKRYCLWSASRQFQLPAIFTLSLTFKPKLPSILDLLYHNLPKYLRNSIVSN